MLDVMYHRAERRTQQMNVINSNKLILPWFLMIAFCLFACSCAHQQQPVNMREKMLRSSQIYDPHFPDETGEKLTYFAYIGKVHTNSGELHVAHVLSALTGMPSPRGQKWIAFYDEAGQYVGRQTIHNAKPLWCEGSKVFLFGDDTADGENFGNAWELADGFENRKIVIDKSYGSYFDLQK